MLISANQQLTLCMLFPRPPIFFSRSIFSKTFVFNFFFLQKFLSQIPSKCQTDLDPDQARQFVGPDLGPKQFERLPADDTSRQRVQQAN